MEQIFNELHLKVNLDTKRKTLIAVWKGYCDKEKFKLGIDFISQYVKMNRSIHFMITDVREQGAVEQESTDYAASLVPRMIEYGMNNLLFILPESIITQMSVEMYKDRLNTTSVEKHSFDLYFSTMDEALKWIDYQIEGK